MAVRALACAALVRVAAGTINLAISDCGDSATHGHVTAINPTSVKQGKKTVVTGSGHLDTTVSDGSFDINVKAAGVTVQSCKGDLCSASKCSLPAGTGSVDFHGVACPLAAGDVSLDFDVTVSRFVPSSLASLDIEITSEGSAGKLLCAKISTSPGANEEEFGEAGSALRRFDDFIEQFKNLVDKTFSASETSQNSEETSEETSENSEKTSENSEAKETQDLGDGLTITVIRPGDGKTFPTAGDRLTMHYTGTINGAKFDSSRDRQEPFVFRVGVGQVIVGWDRGVPQMSLGERALLHVPAKMAYGATGAGNVIPPNADLDFDVELLQVGSQHEMV